MQSEEVIAGTVDGKVDAAQRNLIGQCPKHGAFWASHIGNHSSLAEGEFKKKFTKNVRKRLLNHLGPSEQRIFKKALEGKLMVEKELVEKWEQLLSGGGDNVSARRSDS